MKKKVLGLLVALCLIIGMLPLAVLADPAPANLTIGQAASFTSTAGATNGYYLNGDEQIPFGPAAFWFVTSGAGDANWRDNIAPTFVMNPGDPAKYYTTTASDSANPDYTYLNATEDTTNWNVKFEYPMGGTPTMTLKGANLKNGGGIWYGAHSQKVITPLNIVVESDSTIDVTPVKKDNTSPALALCTTGGVTVSGAGKLTLKSNSTMGGICTYGNLTLNNADVEVYDTAVYQKGNLLYAGPGDLTIKGGKLYANGVFAAAGWPNGALNYLIYAANLTIEDGADVTIMGSAFKGYGAADAGIQVSGSFTVKNSDVTLAATGGFTDDLFAKAPVLEGVTAVASGSKGSYNYETGEYTAPAEPAEFNAESIANLFYFNTVHTCAADADDHDCTTASVCKYCGEEMAAAEAAHTPEEDDGDCTTDVMCANEGCEQVATIGASTHNQPADDGDCTTAVICDNDGCEHEFVPAAEAHTGGEATCENKAECEVCGKEYGELAEHTYERTDCTEDSICEVCGEVAVEAGEHTGGEATCENKAECEVCGEEYGELAEHTPKADDGDCTTAIKCSVCDEETTAAKEAHAYTDNSDASCNNAGCTKTRTIEAPKPGTNGSPQTGDNTALVVLFSLLAVSALGIASVLVFKKKAI